MSVPAWQEERRERIRRKGLRIVETTFQDFVANKTTVYYVVERRIPFLRWERWFPIRADGRPQEFPTLEHAEDFADRLIGDKVQRKTRRVV